MFAKWIRLFALGLALAIPFIAQAQGYGRDRDRYGGDRYEITVINNWDRPVDVTIAAERRDEVVREHWNIAPRATTWLAHEGGRRIRVRGSDRIKVRHDMPSVRISDVAYYRNGVWTVSVRDVVRGQRDRDDMRR